MNFWPRTTQSGAVGDVCHSHLELAIGGLLRHRCGNCPALPVRGMQQLVIDSPVQVPMFRRRADEIAARRYSPLTSEQWVEAVFHAPESLTQVSLQMTVRARCLPWSSAS